VFIDCGLDTFKADDVICALLVILNFKNQKTNHVHDRQSRTNVGQANCRDPPLPVSSHLSPHSLPVIEPMLETMVVTRGPTCRALENFPCLLAQ